MRIFAAAVVFVFCVVLVAAPAAAWLGCNDPPKWNPEMINVALTKFYEGTQGPTLWPVQLRANWDRADKCAFDGNERAHPPPMGTRCVVGGWHRMPPTEDGGLLYLEHVAGGASGPLPEEFKAFQMIDFIGLWNNSITGNLWDTSFHCFIHRVDLSHNRMSGELDAKTFFANSQRHLELLNLGFNQFSGAIPPTLANLEMLNSVLLNDNKFSGPIPDLSHLQRLRHLNLANNLLSGGVGPWLKQLVALSVLQLDGNPQLGGPLPELPDSIVRFSASGSGFSGPIPVSYGQLPMLRIFNCTGCDALSCPTPDLFAHLLYSTHCKPPRVWA